ncbi:MAG: GDSL-type esterase/lipase family protein [Planctomycetota bacterium]
MSSYPSIQRPAITVLLCILAIGSSDCYARTILRESFETTSMVHWGHAWGSAAVVTEQAHAGTKSLKCIVEDKYGMSVHYCDFPARPGATYELSAWLLIPKQEKECCPVLQLCTEQWGPMLAQAKPEKTGEWVQLRCSWKNEENRATVRVALHNAPMKAGLGGAYYYWDDVTLAEEGGTMEVPGARGKNPNVIQGLAVTPAGGMKIAIAAGKAHVADREVTVEAATVDIAPQRVLVIHYEQHRLSDEAPGGYAKATALTHCVGMGPTLPGIVDPASIVVKEKPDGDLIYEKGKDWRADDLWGRIGRIPEGRIKAEQTVFVDYRVRLQRVDTICISFDGKVYARQGVSEKVCPTIPGADYGSLALCNIYLPFGCAEITEENIYPIGLPFPHPDLDFLETHRQRVAEFRAKLDRGEDVTLVTWGDSVTCGGDATRPEYRFADAFVQALRYKYPQARIKLVNAGRGGWNSNKSLPLFEDDVLKHKPDLVTIEYVNDMGITEENMRKNYFEAIDRIRAIGGEVIIITPHFTMPQMMKLAGVGTPETRAAVGVLRKICEEKKVALADASKRWEHLAAEGIPYYTYLRNGINHPNDAGHQLFVDELMRLF